LTKRRRCGLSVECTRDDLEVGDGTGAPKIKLILAGTEVARATTLAAAGVCLAVFDGDPLAKLLPTHWGGRPLAELVLKRLVGRDLDLAPPPRAGIGALRAQRTRVTRRRRKLDGGAELEALLLTRWVLRGGLGDPGGGSRSDRVGGGQSDRPGGGQSDRRNWSNHARLGDQGAAKTDRAEQPSG
jgi:hypothetical protein